MLLHMDRWSIWICFFASLGHLPFVYASLTMSSSWWRMCRVVLAFTAWESTLCSLILDAFSTISLLQVKCPLFRSASKWQLYNNTMSFLFLQNSCNCNRIIVVILVSTISCYFRGCAKSRNGTRAPRVKIVFKEFTSFPLVK